MPYFAWLGTEQNLSPAALTVRAQTISPNDDGRLLWDAFFPRRNVDSIRRSAIGTVDYRPAGDRREWNQRGRIIPLRTPGTFEMEMIPIETTFSVDEYEVQRLMEQTLGNQAQFREIIGARIPDRVDGLVNADYRRIEVDAMTSWALGQVTAKDPQTGQTVTVSWGFDASRYQTAPTAWNDAGLNAYDEFIAWLEDGYDAVGSIAGVMGRLASVKAIQADAPTTNGITLTRAQLVDRIQQDIGGPFQFYVNENTIDIFADGGLDTVRTKVWPTGRLALVPAGEAVGTMDFAPVHRAMELAQAVPSAAIDIRGVTVVYETGGMGRSLTVEAQVNAAPSQDEGRTFVIDIGV